MAHRTGALQLWGGIECTVARVQDTVRDQITEIGHRDRERDLDQIAALGIRTLRYPVLWETIAPNAPGQCDWRWHDKQLGRMRELDISPIAGLVHHGSGPLYTSLDDPAFPALLAEHAARVAERYPWIDKYTPVNEPLTTARFSGMYGHWYPHGTNEAMFLRTLVHQCRAVVLAMTAIRHVNPAAQLVQTEDMGKVFSTAGLQYQADYENQRRWLSFDLLCGRVDRQHPWHERFLEHGIGAGELVFFLEQPCTPDIIGVNHYLTSERYLDERIELFPQHHRGANLSDCYADVEAVRIEFEDRPTGPLPRLREVWERYRLPIAVTEVHHGNTRDEQMRWLKEVWDAACLLRQEGVDLRAVTMWSLFGCMDWNTLLTQRNGFYEPGVFDVRCTPPRPTALATAATAIVRTGNFAHPVLDQAGWWQRDDRYYRTPQPAREAPTLLRRPRAIVITGATGTLGRAFARICTQRGLPYVVTSRSDMDITSPQSVDAALKKLRPWALINAAGYVQVDQAEREQERCFQENAYGAEMLAVACARLDIPYVAFSSDLVFDGTLGRAYVESDAVCPTGVYGRSKATAERLVQEAFPEALVVRTSAFFSPWDNYNFIHTTLRALHDGRRVAASDAVMVSPTYVPDLVHTSLDLLIDRATGVWHLANQGVISWHELAVRAASAAGIDARSLVRAENVQASATALSSERGVLLPPLEGALHRYARDTVMLH
jgi:dTDP-4-dehydrorhamnose reductase